MRTTKINSPVFSILLIILFGARFAVSGLSGQESFDSNWSGSRIWVGPEYWANPLQDWRVDESQVVALAAHDRTLHLLTYQVTETEGEFEMEVQVRLDGTGTQLSSELFVGGFRIGIRGELDGYQPALVHGVEWIDMGVRGDGVVVLDKLESTTKLSSSKWVRLRLKVIMSGATATLRLSAQEMNGQRSAVLETKVLSDNVVGNLALLANGPNQIPERSKGPTWRFRDWTARGDALSENWDRRFGPILWTQYTLSRKTLKLVALMAPVNVSNELVRMEIKKLGRWQEVAKAKVDPLSRTVLFRIDGWDDTKDHAYRVLYRWEGEEHSWAGTVRKDPRDKPVVSVGAFSCDNGYIFPNTTIVRNVGIQNPDLLYFAGDQIYESFGGFGKTRSPVHIAALDYLRKYWMFGWSWRELLKDRPSVIIPDDHDVFQGNIWGHGGRRIPDMSDPPTGQDQSKGGYIMHPDWVNAVQRTQTLHLPDPVDPSPVEQGIGVYFTDMSYGGLSFAVLEDRKFKSGPDSFINNMKGSRDRSAMGMNLENAELLGPRQEAFLKAWVRDGEGDFKVALTQTIFCKVTTHTGRNLRASESGTDSNGWPPEKRNLALGILGRDVVMVHGDQHLGALVRQGVDEWEDGPIGFMVPGTANGFPRAWWPEEPGENRNPEDPYWTGRYLDSLGNRMTVLAVANPERGSNLIPRGAQDPESIGHQKGSGHGILKFNRKTGDVSFEMWRLQFDAANPNLGDQFNGFPKTLKLKR